MNGVCNNTTRGVETVITQDGAQYRGRDAQVNYREDLEFGEKMQEAIVNRFDFNSGAVGRDNGDFPVTRDCRGGAADDPGLGNFVGYSPLRAAVIEVEYMTNVDVIEYFWCPYLCCIRPLPNGRPVRHYMEGDRICLTFPALEAMEACNDAQQTASTRSIEQRIHEVADSLTDEIMDYITGNTDLGGANIRRYPLP